MKKYIKYVVLGISLLFYLYSIITTFINTSNYYPDMNYDSKLAYVDYDEVKDIVKDKDVVIEKNIGYINITRIEEDFLPLTVLNSSKKISKSINIIKGSFPKNENEILVPDMYLNLFEVNGDKINLRYCNTVKCSKVLEKEYTISGVYELNDYYNSFFTNDEFVLEDSDKVNIYYHSSIDIKSKLINLFKSSITEKGNTIHYLSSFDEFDFYGTLNNVKFMFYIQLILFILLGSLLVILFFKNDLSQLILFLIVSVVSILFNVVNIVLTNRIYGDFFYGYILSSKEVDLENYNVKKYEYLNNEIKVKINNKIYSARGIRISGGEDKAYTIVFEPNNLKEIKYLNNLKEGTKAIVNNKYTVKLKGQTLAELFNFDFLTYTLEENSKLEKYYDENLKINKLYTLYLDSNKSYEQISDEEEYDAFMSGTINYDSEVLRKSIFNYYVIIFLVVVSIIINVILYLKKQKKPSLN